MLCFYLFLYRRYNNFCAKCNLQGNSSVSTEASPIPGHLITHFNKKKIILKINPTMLEVYLPQLPSLAFTEGKWDVFWSLIYFRP